MAGQNRDKIVEAFLALLAEQPFEKVDLRAIAKCAELSLADLRREFNSVFDVLAAFVRSTDEKLLAEGFDPELSGTPARERLFEVLMQRIEILKDHRAAMRSIARSARSNPPFALALNGLALRSAQWMLAAAEIDSGGLQGCVRAQGLVVVMARTYRVWLDDEDPGLARTMAALDRELANGERALGLIGNLCRFVPRFGGGGRRRRRGMDNETAAA
jgi:AcrR family transcriptional regulator